MTNGRVVAAPGDSYLIRCFLTRQESSGTSSGADYLPSQGNPGDNFPGASGLVYFYKGYGLEWVKAPVSYVAGGVIPSDLGWTSLTAGIPVWLSSGVDGVHVQGLEQPKFCSIERITGRYGNAAIDEIIIKEVGGIPLLVRSGDIIE
jgi:hypothetical protein